MFLRSVKAANGRHEYPRLVESYREGDKIRQRIVMHIGRKDLLAPHLDALGARPTGRSASSRLGFGRAGGRPASLDLGTRSGGAPPV